MMISVGATLNYSVVVGGVCTHCVALGACAQEAQVSDYITVWVRALKSHAPFLRTRN